MVDTQSKAVRLYIVEGQDIYRKIYETIFPSDKDFNLLGISTNQDISALKDAVSTLTPDVLLLGTKLLNRDIINVMKQIHADFPKVGVVLFFAAYHSEALKILRQLTTRRRAGMAIFLRQSLERVDQMHQIIISVGRGHIILDPALTNLLFTESHRHMLLKGITHRELEVLSLLARGYTNSAIAEELFIDIKTVRHHVNNIYNKLKVDAGFNHKHPRVRATRIYLETAGELMFKSSA